jgi:hypothetical protein
VKDFVHRWFVGETEVSLQFEATEAQARALNEYIEENITGYRGMEVLE